MKLYVDKSNNPNLDPTIAEAVKKKKKMPVIQLKSWFGAIFLINMPTSKITG